MLSCCQCEGIERQFGAKTVARELRRYRRRGAARTTRLLIDALRNVGVAGASLLDIRSGVGAIHHALLDSGADRGTHIDISPDFLEAAEREAARRGHSDRVRFVLGDFVQLASSVDPGDIVTLDRVICCYPDMESLVAHAAQRARRVVGAVYPRASWWVRAGVRLTNALMRVRRCPFRVYVHSPLAIDAAFSGQGLKSFQNEWHTHLGSCSVHAADRCDRRRCVAIPARHRRPRLTSDRACRPHQRGQAGVVQRIRGQRLGLPRSSHSK